MSNRSSYHHYQTCQKYMNQQVEIRTVHGTYRGKIVNVDNEQVYLQINSPDYGGRNKAHISFFPFILPLVLFDLLVIVLLESSPFRRGLY